MPKKAVVKVAENPKSLSSTQIYFRHGKPEAQFSLTDNTMTFQKIL